MTRHQWLIAIVGMVVTAIVYGLMLTAIYEVWWRPPELIQWTISIALSFLSLWFWIGYVKETER